MSWTRYLFHDFWTAREFNDIEAERRRRGRNQRRRNQDHRQRIEELEDDVGRLALATRTMAEVLLRKGMVTPDELAQITAEVDRMDGEADGRFDPDRIE